MNAPGTSTSQCYFFDPIVVKVQLDAGVWEITPHGQTLGVGMAKSPHAFAGKSVIEIGTGTGVHAIAALKLGARYIDVTDIDDTSLISAQENAARNGVSFRNVDKYDWMNFEPLELYDTLLCNPPFCKSGKPDRRYFISQLIAEACRFIRPGGHIMFCQSSMADFSKTEAELSDAGFVYSHQHTSRGMFRDYYFTEPHFIDDSKSVVNGFEEIEGVYIETLKAYLCTLATT